MDFATATPAEVTVNVAAADVAPLGLFTTVTLAAPGEAIRAAGTAAVSWLALTVVVVNAVVPHFAVAPETKFAPLIVSVKAAPPAVAQLGLKLVIVGGGLMVNVDATEDPPPGL
jgi:hypothetical protein